MMKPSCLYVICTSALAAILAVGCGTTGSAPTTFPEVRFKVLPHAGATFTAVLVAGGVQHTFPAAFTATAEFDFILENAAPPYGGTFTLVEGAEIDVTLSVKGAPTDLGPIKIDAINSPVDIGTVTPTPSPTPSLEVRFDVCTPSGTNPSCLTPGGDAGVFGQGFNASVGDAFDTHLVGGAILPTAPSIIFLDGARDSVHGVFALQPSTGQTLIARLYVNGELKETGADTGDVVIKYNF
ncbi:MAG: hypothetical protein ACHQ9S_21660 [Candidatus Binatia bacterium]